MARLELNTAAAATIISLSEAKSHLRVTHDADDTYITNLIPAATEVAQNYACSKFINETYTMYMADWGDVYVSNSFRLQGGYYDTLKGPNSFKYGGYYSKFTGLRQIVLPYAPLSSVVSVKYYDSANNQQTITSTDYNVLKFINQKRFIEFNDGYDLPSVYPRADAIEIQFKAGYGSAASNVPKAIYQATLLILGQMYEKREDSVSKLPKASEYILDPYRIKTY